MCWVNNTCVKHIATKDISIFKCVDEVNIQYCISLVTFFKYQYERLYTLDSDIIVEESNGLYFINEGFHSYSMKKTNQYKGNPYLVKGIIPKGAVYYYSFLHREYVSNQIIIHKPNI